MSVNWKIRQSEWQQFQFHTIIHRGVKLKEPNKITPSTMYYIAYYKHYNYVLKQLKKQFPVYAMFDCDGRRV